MNPFTMILTMMTVYAVCNLLYACWMLYKVWRRELHSGGNDR